MRQANHNQHGVTLIELLVVMVILAITLTLALPSFNDTNVRNRLASQTNEILASINLARSLAIQSSARGGVCAANNDQTACGADWANGIIVWVDEDRSGGFTAGEVRRAARLDAADQLTGGNSLIFNNRGQRVTPAAGNFDLSLRPVSCSAGEPFQRRIRVTLTGTTNQLKENCA
jgi:type IV fimbrial biogenesis protein FimT